MSLGPQKEQYRLLDQLGQEATGPVRQLPEKMCLEKGYRPKGAMRVLTPPGPSGDVDRGRSTILRMEKATRHH